MNFEENYILENNRVRLSPLGISDFANLLPYSTLEPDLWKYSLVQAIGEDGLRHYIELALAGRQAEREYPFIVWDKTHQKYVGSTRFYDIQLKHKTLQLGYTWYGKIAQGTGVNKNCKFLLLEFAFDTLGMERVEFRADIENKRSIAAMHSIGCQTEGILRSNCFKQDGSRRDSIVLSILKSEWESHVKSMLKQKINSK